MKISISIHWSFFTFYFALAPAVFGQTNVDQVFPNMEKRQIYGPAANLFIESLLQAGVPNHERQKDIVKFHVEEVTCLNPFARHRVAVCAIWSHGSTLLPSTQIAEMLLRVLRANGVNSSPAQVKDVECLRPAFPFPLGICTYIILQTVKPFMDENH